jgi:hypothetical protein
MPMNVHPNFIFLGPDDLSPRNQLQLYVAIQRPRGCWRPRKRTMKRAASNTSVSQLITLASMAAVKPGAGTCWLRRPPYRYRVVSDAASLGGAGAISGLSQSNPQTHVNRRDVSIDVTLKSA